MNDGIRYVSSIDQQRTVSSTVRASTPGTSRFSLAGTMPRLDASPMVGRMPTHAQSLAGPRTESPVSVPRPARPKDAATAAAEPPLEPAVVLSAPLRTAVTSHFV